MSKTTRFEITGFGNSQDFPCNLTLAEENHYNVRFGAVSLGRLGSFGLGVSPNGSIWVGLFTYG